MKKRPLSIIAISLFYLCQPIGNLFQAAYINKLPLTGGNGILHHLLWSDWIILGLFPVVALGIYMVRKWGWYLIIGFSAILISYNLYVCFYLNPNYQFQTVLFFIIIITGTTAVFFKKHISAPYFNPRLRWWEVASRYKIRLKTKILTNDTALDCQMIDVSLTGCLVDYPGNLTIGESVWLIIQCAGVKLNCLGRIIRKSSKPNSKGYGIFFQSMSQDTRLKIKRLIKTLEAQGGKDREGIVPVSRIPLNFYAKSGNFLSQFGLKMKAAF